MMKKTGETIHIHMMVETLLAMDDKEFSETVTHPDGPNSARLELKSMLESGKTCLVLDSSCNDRNDNGSCAGHPFSE